MSWVFRTQTCELRFLNLKIWVQFSGLRIWGRDLEKSKRKIENFSKFQKCTKSISKESKRVLNMFCGNFFEFFLPSVPWRVQSSKVFKKIKIFPKIQKCPKSFPIVFKRVLNMFWGNFSEFFFAQCFMEGPVFESFQKNQNFFKNPKMPKIVPNSVQTKRVLNMFWGNFSEKKFAQCSMEGRVFESFQKNHFWKFQRMSKIVPKIVQTCFEHVLGQLFKIFFLPSVSSRVKSPKFFRKVKNFQNSKNARNRSEMCPNVFWTCFGAIFPKFFFRPVFHGGSSLQKFSKKSNFLQKSKKAQNRSQ